MRQIPTLNYANLRKFILKEMYNVAIDFGF